MHLSERVHTYELSFIVCNLCTIIVNIKAVTGRNRISHVLLDLQVKRRFSPKWVEHTYYYYIL
jgi:hypothetical protein